MARSSVVLCRIGVWCALAGVGVCVSVGWAQDAPGFAPPVSREPVQPEANSPEDSTRAAGQAGHAAGAKAGAADQGLVGAGADYDLAMFQRPIAKDQMAFLSQYGGAPSGEVWRDKMFRKLLKQVIPDCMFHYGRDKSLEDALDEAIAGSGDRAEVRDGRYLMISGERGQYLGGRGFVWIDMQDGVGLGGFYFHPTNGEPTPTLSVFSRQVKEKALGMSQLPLAFAEDLSVWAQGNGVPGLTTRYFLTGSNRRILLEHDEDYCSPADGSAGPPMDACEQMNADAADTDVDTAYYLKQVNYATNATAWMINGPELTAWIGVRTGLCGGVADPLGCRVRVTHEHVHTVTGRPAPMPHPGGHR